MSGVKRFKVTHDIAENRKPEEIAAGITKHSAEMMKKVIEENGPGLYDISLTKVRNLREGE